MKRHVATSLIAAGLCCPVVPAQAAPIEREHYSGTDQHHFDDCGFRIDVLVEYEGRFMLKAPRSDGGPPYVFDNYHHIDTLTANGRTLTIEGQGMYKDLRITHVEGTVYQFVAMESGRPILMRGEDGDVLRRDRGMLRTTFQVDTKGDTDLANDVFVEGSFELLADRGRHPWWYEDGCAFFRDYFLAE